jgi:hypothetical protein
MYIGYTNTLSIHTKSQDRNSSFDDTRLVELNVSAYTFLSQTVWVQVNIAITGGGVQTKLNIVVWNTTQDLFNKLSLMRNTSLTVTLLTSKVRCKPLISLNDICISQTRMTTYFYPGYSSVVFKTSNKVSNAMIARHNGLSNHTIYVGWCIRSC